MAFNNPSVADFQQQFFRDFPYSIDHNIGVLDSDITYAFQLVNFNINQGLFSDQGSYSVAYNLLAAHYLCLNLRASSQGINGQYNWIQNNKNVGAVSEGFQIPERIAGNPYFVMLTKTNYGARYFELILPLLSGKMYSSYMPARSI